MPEAIIEIQSGKDEKDSNWTFDNIEVLDLTPCETDELIVQIQDMKSRHVFYFDLKAAHELTDTLLNILERYPLPDESDREIAALRRVYSAFRRMDKMARRRCIDYVNDRIVHDEAKQHELPAHVTTNTEQM